MDSGFRRNDGVEADEKDEGKRAEKRASALHSAALSNTARAAASPAIKPLAKQAVSR